MALKLKDKYKYSLVVPTSMGIRISPLHGQPVHSADTFAMQVTSAETNAASVVSYLGCPVKVLTAFVKDSPISHKIKSNLASRHMDFEGPQICQGGPWGYRHQINIADSGFGTRGPRVFNDRAGEVGRILSTKDFDLERIFGDEGVRIVHISGLFAALSPDTGKFCLEIAKIAKKHDTLVSFDLNHRASFWKNRKTELRKVFTGIAKTADILLGNEEDFQLCLGLEGPESGGKNVADKIEGFREMIKCTKSEYPGASLFATTLREVKSANSHMWGAIMLQGDNIHVVEPRHIDVLDRIGGGDAFVGGLLYGTLKEWDPQKSLYFGWACGAMATTFLTDYIQPADEEQIWDVWEGNARVKR